MLLCEIRGLADFQKKSNPEAAHAIPEYLRTTVKRKGYLAGGEAFLFEEGKIAFFLPEKTQQDVADLAERLAELLQSTTLAGILRLNWPYLDLEDELKKLSLKIRMEATESTTPDEALKFAGQRFREWQ